MKVSAILKSPCLPALLLLLAASTAKASLVVTFSQVGTDVILSRAAGTLDLTGLTRLGNASACNDLSTGTGGYVGGGGTNACSWFVAAMTVTRSAGWTQAASSSTAGSVAWTAFQGASVLYANENLGGNPARDSLFLATDTGLAVAGVNTFGQFTGRVANRTLASLGLTANQSLEFRWGADSVLFTTSVVPEPATLALSVVALAGLAGTRRKAAAA